MAFESELHTPVPPVKDQVNLEQSAMPAGHTRRELLLTGFASLVAGTVMGATGKVGVDYIAGRTKQRIATFEITHADDTHQLSEEGAKILANIGKDYGSSEEQLLFKVSSTRSGSFLSADLDAADRAEIITSALIDAGISTQKIDTSLDNSSTGNHSTITIYKVPEEEARES